MHVAEFIAKWRRSERTERAAAQEHFLDLCEVVGHEKPGEVDPAGEWFTFERGAAKEGGGQTCGWHGVENDVTYNPQECFETFPFSAPPLEQEAAIAEAARCLDEMRRNWLNPPEWTRTETLEFPGSLSGPWARYVTDADERGIGTVRYPRTVARDEHAAELARRTLTNLYNQRPAWLAHAHAELDAAVASAYRLAADLPDAEILARLLELNNRK